jgi:hypothetical protein
MPGDSPAVPGLGLPSRGLDVLPGLQDEAPDVLRGAGGESPAEPGGDPRVTSILSRAASLRFPSVVDLSAREKIEALSDYIMQTAIGRGELEELRLEAHTNLRTAKLQLEEIFVPSGSKAAVEQARRRAAPDLAAEVDGARWLVERCGEQISRLEADYTAASRTYTLLSGS